MTVQADQKVSLCIISLNDNLPLASGASSGHPTGIMATRRILSEALITFRTCFSLKAPTQHELNQAGKPPAGCFEQLLQCPEA
ncbi:MAG: hypothetical protein ABSF65_03100 [Candidatus Bathyarchaeia archaeon]